MSGDQPSQISPTDFLQEHSTKERSPFQQMNTHKQKNKLHPKSHALHKVNSKWLTDLNAKYKHSQKRVNK